MDFAPTHFRDMAVIKEFGTPGCEDTGTNVGVDSAFQPSSCLNTIRNAKNNGEKGTLAGERVALRWC